MKDAGSRSRLGAVLLAAAIMAGVIGAARAQNDFAAAKLDAFIAAAITVDALVAGWMPRINEAASQEQSNELQKQARAEIVAAIERAEGITLEEYQQIGQAARSDPEFSTRLRKMYRDKKGN
jgi:hypothetical protein